MSKIADNIIRFMINRPVVFTVLAVLVWSPFSYLLALVGEPRAVWIWRDILGVL